MVRYSLSAIFKEQLGSDLMDPLDQNKIMKEIRDTTNQLTTFVKHQEDIKVLNIQVKIKTKLRIVLRYTKANNRLTAKKILFS